ncbi:MAG: transcriptional repressor [Bacteroidetes bacterium]|nr:transcriptional repressor [Bacteroidota bacterium]
MSEQNKEIALLFKEKKISATSSRILIYKAILDFEDTFSLMDIENKLDTVDKSTIFRALTLFDSYHLIHSLEDGSGSMKYCRCNNNGECKLDENHCHFFCEVCKKTFCMNHNQVPVIPIETGFIVHSVTYLIKGICPDCAKHIK